jgi:hypothetical protein
MDQALTSKGNLGELYLLRLPYDLLTVALVSRVYAPAYDIC